MVTAWAPGHISMVFAAKTSDPEPLKRGSLGLGMCLDMGVSTQIFDSSTFKITYNNMSINTLQGSSRHVFEYMKQNYPEIHSNIHIKHMSKIPISAGLSSSAAGAIGTAFAINQFFNLGLKQETLFQYAHLGELKAVTGLGDVLAIAQSGVVIRTKEGAPGYGDALSVPFLHDLYVHVAIFEGISTKHVLLDPVVMKTINTLGESFIQHVKTNPSLQALLDAAYSFSLQTPIATEHAKIIMKHAKNKGIMGVGLAMIGQTIYFIDKDPSLLERLVPQVIHDTQSKPRLIFKTRVSNKKPFISSK